MNLTDYLVSFTDAIPTIETQFCRVGSLMSDSDQAEFRFSLEHLPWEVVAPGLRVKARQVGDHNFRLLEFTTPFQEVEWCMKGHCGYVLDGEMIVNIDGSLVTFKKGDAINIPANIRHQHHFTNQSTTLFVIEELDAK